MAAKVPNIYLELSFAKHPNSAIRNHDWGYSIRLVQADGANGYWTGLSWEYDYTDTVKGGASSRYYQFLSCQGSISESGARSQYLAFSYNLRFASDRINEVQAHAMYRTLNRLGKSFDKSSIALEAFGLDGLGGQLVLWAKAFGAKGIIVDERFKDRSLDVDLSTATRLNQIFDAMGMELSALNDAPLDSLIIAKTDMIDSRGDHPGVRTLVTQDGYRIVEMPFADQCWKNQSTAWRNNGSYVEMTGTSPRLSYA